MSDRTIGFGLTLGYLILSIVFFLPALAPGKMIFGSDYVAASYFFEAFATRQFQAGTLPAWLPFVYGGVPFFANPMDVYYPVSLLLRLGRIPTHEHLGILFAVQFFLAGVGTYLLLREMGARRLAAYLAGLCYMFTGYLISHIYAGHDGRAIVATLAPLLFFTLHRAFRTGRTRWYVSTGVVLGAAVLSFQLQTAYYLTLAALLWSAFLVWHLGLLKPGRVLATRVGGGLLAVAIAVALTSVNLAPFLGYVSSSPRGGEGGRGYEYSVSWSMPIEEIVGVAVPERIGILTAYWGQNPFKLHTEYVGALVVALLLLATVLPGRKRYSWFFLGLGLFYLSIAFGGHTPLYRLYYALLPGASKFRAPSVSFFLVAASLVVLAGLALDRLADLREAGAAQRSGRRDSGATDATTTARRLTYLGALALIAVLVWGVVVTATPTPAPVGVASAEAARAVRAAANHSAYVQGIWRFALFFALTLGTLWAWTYRKIDDRLAAVLLVAFTIADLWVIDKKFFAAIPEPAVYFAPDEVASFLQEQPGPFRTFVLFDLPQDDYLTLFGVELVGGEHGNQLQSYNEFLGAGERTYTDFHNMGHPTFLALANARYIVTGQDVQAPFLKPVFSGRTRSGRTATVYENESVLPRAFLAASARVLGTSDQTLELMRSPQFDPGREVLLYEEPPQRTETTEPLEGTAQITLYEASHVVVRTSANQPAYLVLSDNYYAGWVAELDAAPVPILRANHTFRAVPVPAGEHEVVFRFRPRALAAGFYIYTGVGLGLLLYGLALAVAVWRGRPATAG